MARNLLKFEPNGSIDSGCLYLEQIGIDNYDHDEYIDGVKRVLKIDDKEAPFFIKIKPISMKIDYEL